RAARRRELREHLTYLATLERPDPEERVLAVERYHAARELAKQLAPEGTSDRESVAKLLDTVAERLGVEE
ncbi:hypothetical protein L0Y40_01965, partial [Candidatus Wolfebacteria bacterium]|nr:hypothetical protein [Candidatus Wolfebacteria bacterium]